MTNEHTDPQNVLFLLAIAPLGIGCEITTNDDAGTTAGTGTAETAGDTEVGTSTATDGSGGGTTTDPSDTTAGSEATTAAPEDTTAGSDATTGTSVGVCEDYAALFEYCYGAKDPMAGPFALEACNDYLDYFGVMGDDCLIVFEDYIACLSTLSCEDFMQGVGCETEENAFGLACLGA